MNTVQNGKTSRRRQGDDPKAYARNYDRIFKKGAYAPCPSPATTSRGRTAPPTPR